MRSLRYEPSASVCALMVATPGLVGWSRIRPLVGEPSRAALGAAGTASPKTRDGGDFGGSTAGGGAGAITPPGMESQLRVLPDAFEPPGRHGSSLGTEPQLRVLPVASEPRRSIANFDSPASCVKKGASQHVPPHPMAASIPFTSIDDVILALAKIDVLHKHIAHAEGDASTIGPGDDFLLIPYCIHDVARGDHLLFDGASFFGESADLRFRVGDRVEVDLDGVWALGSVVRQPVQDGELEAYDVVLDEISRQGS